MPKIPSKSLYSAARSLMKNACLGLENMMSPTYELRVTEKLATCAELETIDRHEYIDMVHNRLGALAHVKYGAEHIKDLSLVQTIITIATTTVENVGVDTDQRRQFSDDMEKAIMAN
jgi:replicative DNA helicase